MHIWQIFFVISTLFMIVYLVIERSEKRLWLTNYFLLITSTSTSERMTAKSSSSSPYVLLLFIMVVLLLNMVVVAESKCYTWHIDLDGKLARQDKMIDCSAESWCYVLNTHEPLAIVYLAIRAGGCYKVCTLNAYVNV